MSVWNQDPMTGDMVLSIIGGTTTPAGLAPVIQTDPGKATALILDNKLSMWLGEWYLDTSQGTPWLTVLGVKNPDLNVVRQMLQAIIAGTPPVAVVNDVSVSFDRATRNLLWSWTATLASGEVITGGSVPYVVPEGP